MELLYYNRSVVRAFDYRLYIFLALCFWRIFTVVSLYVVDMFAYYTNTLFEYLSLYIKADKNPLNDGDVLCSYFSIKILKVYMWHFCIIFRVFLSSYFSLFLSHKTLVK
jgi:hypothetical protein